MHDRHPAPRRHARWRRWWTAWDGQPAARGSGRSAWSATAERPDRRARRAVSRQPGVAARRPGDRCDARGHRRGRRPDQRRRDAARRRHPAGPLSNYQIESHLPLRRRDPGASPSRSPGAAPGSAGARRRGRLAGQGRVPAGVGHHVHLRPGQARRDRRIGGRHHAGPAAAALAGGDTVRVAFRPTPPARAATATRSPRPQRACARRERRGPRTCCRYVADS